MLELSGAGAPSCGGGARRSSTTSWQAKVTERHHAATRANPCRLVLCYGRGCRNNGGSPKCVNGWGGRATDRRPAQRAERRKGRRARKGKDRGERPNRAHTRVAGARQWASLARVPVGVLRDSLAPIFFMRCPPYDPILVTGMTHRFQGARVALRVVHFGPGTEFGGRKIDFQGSNSSCFGDIYSHSKVQSEP